MLPTDITKYVAEAGLASRSRGVLSLSAWKDQLVTITFPPRARVTIEPGTLPEPNGQDTFPLDPETGELRVSVLVADQTVHCRVEPLHRVDCRCRSVPQEAAARRRAHRARDADDRGSDTDRS